MRWIRKHKKTAGILCFLLILAGAILFSGSEAGRKTAAGSLIRQGVAAVQKPFSAAGRGLRENVGGILNYRAVVRENKELKREISRLKTENIDLRLKASQLEDLSRLSAALDYRDPDSGGAAVAADVIAMDSSSWFNVFTVNRGTESGIGPGSVVTDGSALAGKVTGCGKGWAKVTAVIDESSSVSFKVLRDMSLLGIVQGDGKGGLKGFMLDGKASVIDGDTVVTTSIGIYPQGLEIGKITDVRFNNDTQLREVTIEPSADFKNLQRVAVLP